MTSDLIERLLPCPFCGQEPESNTHFAWCFGPDDEPHGQVNLPIDAWNRRDALSQSQAEQSEAVGVKPLEWRDLTFGHATTILQADHPHGWFTIRYGLDPEYPWDVQALGQSFKSIEEAKAAAQADYEQRILSALVLASSLSTAIRERDANHNLAVANGKRALEEYNRAEAAIRERDEARAKLFVKELRQTRAERGHFYRAEATEALLSKLREGLEKIVSCYDRNWQRQREKLDDIIPLARDLLADTAQAQETIQVAATGDGGPGAYSPLLDELVTLALKTEDHCHDMARVSSMRVIVKALLERIQQ